MSITVESPAPGAGPRAAGPRLSLTVASIEQAADGVVSLALVHPRGERLPDWAPGAHIDVVLPGGVARQYSLCGDRWDAHTYRIAVLREPAGRGGSDYIHTSLREGDAVHLGGPRNTFRLVPSERYVFVAGGIGITPILPMVRQAELVGADWRLLYLGRSRRTMAFLDELAAYRDRVSVLARDEHGPADLGGLIGPARPDTKVYACGPKRLLDGLAAHCAGWPEGLLRLERFAAADQGAPVLSGPFEVELARSERTVDVGPGVSVLDAVQAAGVPVLSSCRTGTCGTCEVGVLAGVPDHRDSILDDGERRAGDCMFPCVSRSCTDRLVLDL